MIAKNSKSGAYITSLFAQLLMPLTYLRQVERGIRPIELVPAFDLLLASVERFLRRL